MWYSATPTKRTRLSYKKVQTMVDDWNKEHGLVYRNKGFLMLKNDGSHHFLQQISEEGCTSARGIPTHGSLRDCVESIHLAENDLLEK